MTYPSKPCEITGLTGLKGLRMGLERPSEKSRAGR
jgi:hypothetical protein